MIVAVSTRIVQSQDYPETRDALSHDWSALLFSLGATPCLIPNTLFDAQHYLRTLGVERLLLSGGDDLGPLVGERDDPAATQRDQIEFDLLKAAIDLNIPVLGVCRGLQLINVFFGGGITRELQHNTGEQHAGCRHDVVLRDSDARLNVNSYHHHGVLRHQVAPVLQVFAESNAQVVEGLIHREYPISAIMWHPERDAKLSEYDRTLLSQWLT